jgi:hypothetical protein
VGYSTANEGEIYLTSDTDELYLGLQDGSLRKIGNDPNPFVAKHAEYRFISTIEVNSGTAFRDFFENETSNEGAVTQTNHSTITVNEDGLYLITFNCRLDGGILTPVVAELYINGNYTQVYADNGFNYYSNPSSSWNFDYTARITAGQTVRISTYQPPGTYARTVFAQPAHATFTITKIAY